MKEKERERESTSFFLLIISMGLDPSCRGLSISTVVSFVADDKKN